MCECFVFNQNYKQEYRLIQTHILVCVCVRVWNVHVWCGARVHKMHDPRVPSSVCMLSPFSESARTPSKCLPFRVCFCNPFSPNVHTHTGRHTHFWQAEKPTLT